MDAWEQLAGQMFDLWRGKSDEWLKSSAHTMNQTIKKFADKYEGKVTDRPFYTDSEIANFMPRGNFAYDVARNRIVNYLKYRVVTIPHKHWRLVTKVAGPTDNAMFVLQVARFIPERNFILSLDARAHNIEWIAKPFENVLTIWSDIKDVIDKKPKGDVEETVTGNFDLDRQYIIRSSPPKLAKQVLEDWKVRDKLLASQLRSFNIVGAPDTSEPKTLNSVMFVDWSRITSIVEMSQSIECFKSVLDELYERDMITSRAPYAVVDGNFFDF